MIQNIWKSQLVSWSKPYNRSVPLCNKDSLAIRFSSRRVEGGYIYQERIDAFLHIYTLFSIPEHISG